MSTNRPGSAAPLVAALPRSPLHLKLLTDNEPGVDILFYRDAHLEGHLPAAARDRAVYLGRERRDLASPLAARRHNRAYYEHVRAVVGAHRYRKFIIFLESEPLESCIYDLIGPEPIELWEEGLTHYLDLSHPVAYRLRASVQLALGFYPKRIFRTRLDRTGLRVRDRLVEGSLRFVRPAGLGEPRDEVLFLGSPLVQDRLVSRRRYLHVLGRIAAASPVRIRYLPHPREDAGLLPEVAGEGLLTIERDGRGALLHAADFRYRAYLSAFSSASLDIGRFERSFFTAPLFGLGHVARALRAAALPLRTVETVDALGAALRALGPPSAGEE